MREALKLSCRDLGACFYGSPLRCLYLLALALMPGWTWVTTHWPSMDGCSFGNRAARSHRKTAARRRRALSKRGRAAEGLATAATLILVHIDKLRKVYLKPELTSQPGSQDGKAEGTLGWNPEAGVESQPHHLVSV